MFGTWALYEQMQNLFPEAAIKLNIKSPSGLLTNNKFYNTAYILVAPTINFSEIDTIHLNKFIDNGNLLVISAYDLNSVAKAWLRCDVSNFFTSILLKEKIGIWNQDSMGFNYFDAGKMPNVFLPKIDSSSWDDTYGIYASKEKNCICLRRGKGFIYVHTQPYMFTNYHLLKKKNTAYTELFFSNLPKPMYTVYWDEYMKGAGSVSNSGALRFILSQPALRAAFWWAFAVFIILVLLGLKRRLSIVKPPPENSNSTLEMANTISDLYYYSHKNNIMAKKKMAYWLGFVKEKYHVSLSKQDIQFWAVVQKKSSLPAIKIEQLKQYFDLYWNADKKISDQELVILCNNIDEFYK